METRGSHAPRPKPWFKDTLHNEAWLRKHYEEMDMNANEISLLVGCSRASVHHALRKFSITPKSRSAAHKGRVPYYWSDEQKAQMSERRKGAGNPMFGRRKTGVEKIVERRVGNYRPRHRLSRYHMTEAEYDDLLREQGGVCAICKRPERLMAAGGNRFKPGAVVERTGEVRALSVDHDHSTGKRRGLLCHDCNTGLGKLKDDPSLLRAAATYIEAYATP